MDIVLDLVHQKLIWNPFEFELLRVGADHSDLLYITKSDINFHIIGEVFFLSLVFIKILRMEMKQNI